MRTSILVYLSFLLVLISCQKTIEPMADEPANTKDTINTSEFVKYTIKAGEQSSDKNVFKQVEYSEQKFVVKFDNSAKYTTIDTANQHDVNKLYGFSDNGAHHHQFSARFGWRWKDNELHLFGYTYNNGVRRDDDIGKIEIGSEVTCSIKVTTDSYIFTMNGKSHSMPRASTTIKAVGYKLYPFFGGDEMAPHNISIWIKEVL